MNSLKKSIGILSEQNIIFVIYSLLAFIPLVNLVLRPLQMGVRGIEAYVPHTLLLLGFFGAVSTGKEQRHLVIGSNSLLPPRIKTYSDILSGVIAITLLTCLTISSITMVTVAFGGGQKIGIVPVILFVAVIPISYIMLNIQYIVRISRNNILLVVGAIVLGLWFATSPIANLFFIYSKNPPLFLDTLFNAHVVFFSILQVPFLILIIGAAFFGLPLFLVLGGIAIVLFGGQGVGLSIVPLEGYNMLTSSSLSAIPLFTLAGYILSESKASDRLIRVFRNLFGWLPGGLAISAVVASVFFTSFTGASGVTILALGGLLFPMLKKEGHLTERYSVGLLTSSSNIGLLFPPSLAIILYGTIAQINIFHLFLGGLLPGILIMGAFAIFGVVVSVLTRKSTHSTYVFDIKEIVLSIKDALFELLMPVVVVFMLFSGLATLVESAAVAVLYVFVISVFIRKEIALRDIRAVFNKCTVVIAGVLLILTAARALSYFIVDVQIPQLLSEWVSTNISSRFVFLIILNVVLLIAGCFMDIFSAILILSPLVVPLGELFGIHPVHLGIIFLANLGVGFITPPVGLDLFLASYRFNKPLTKIYRYIVPFFILEFIMVLVITYVPHISTFLLRFTESAGGY